MIVFGLCSQCGAGVDFASEEDAYDPNRLCATCYCSKHTTARCAIVGTIAPRSQPAAMRVRGVTVEPTRTPIVLTPLGLAVREACAAILAGELQPCRWCESIAPCDCLRWHEYMLLQDADPHGDLSELQDCDLSY